MGSGTSALQLYPVADAHSWSGQGQLIWQAGPQTSLHALISSRARFATIFERFSQRFGTSIPNPTLTPERATHYEIGGARRFGIFKAEGALYYAHMSDAILSESVIGYSCTASTTPGPCASSVMTQTRNVGSGKNYGAELSIEARLAANLTLGGNYTWVQQQITDPTNPAAMQTGVPNHKAFVYAEWRPTPEWRVVPSAEIASNLWTVTDVAPVYYYRTGGHVNVGLRGDYSFAPGWTASLGVKNLLDRNWQLASGYPEPGRSYYFGLRASY